MVDVEGDKLQASYLTTTRRTNSWPLIKVAALQNRGCRRQPLHPINPGRAKTIAASLLLTSVRLESLLFPASLSNLGEDAPIDVQAGT